MLEEEETASLPSEWPHPSQRVTTLSGILIYRSFCMWIKTPKPSPESRIYIRYIRSGVNASPLSWIMRICCFCESVCAENLLLCCACVTGRLWVTSVTNSPDFYPEVTSEKDQRQTNSHAHSHALGQLRISSEPNSICMSLDREEATDPQRRHRHGEIS